MCGGITFTERKRYRGIRLYLAKKGGKQNHDEDDGDRPRDDRTWKGMSCKKRGEWTSERLLAEYSSYHRVSLIRSSLGMDKIIWHDALPSFSSSDGSKRIKVEERRVKSHESEEMRVPHITSSLPHVMTRTSGHVTCVRTRVNSTKRTSLSFKWLAASVATTRDFRSSSPLRIYLMVYQISHRPDLPHWNRICFSRSSSLISLFFSSASSSYVTLSRITLRIHRGEERGENPFSSRWSVKKICLTSASRDSRYYGASDHERWWEENESHLVNWRGEQTK